MIHGKRGIWYSKSVYEVKGGRIVLRNDVTGFTYDWEVR